jgi:hypothetical protein
MVLYGVAMGRLDQLGMVSTVALQTSVLVLLPRLSLTRMEVTLKSLKLIRSKLIRFVWSTKSESFLNLI